MAAMNKGNNSQGDIDMAIPETSMTGQELLQQIASVVGHNQIVTSQNVPASSPVDTSPVKTSPMIPMCSSTPISKTKRAPTAKASAKVVADDEVVIASNNTDSQSPTLPTVYGELSILGYNGYIPNSERSGRRNKSKFLLCKRPEPNGIKKAEHYIVKQPQATKAIQDKDNYSISYTFSKSQTIIVEYKQDDKTDLFQIGRSSEEPIDFVVMDTLPSGGCPIDVAPSQNSRHQNSSNRHSLGSSSTNHHQHPHHNGLGQNHNSEIASGSQHTQQPYYLGEMTRLHRHLAKVEEEMRHRGIPPFSFDPRNRLPTNMYGHVAAQSQQMLLNYPQPNLSNLPPLMAEHFRRQDPTLFHIPPYNMPPSGSVHNQQPHQFSRRSNQSTSGDHQNNSSDGRHNIYHQHSNNQNINDGSCNNHQSSSKRSHAAQSTISRFACRIIVERGPPYTARIYAAGFDSSKNIFLGEKATKWEQNNSIDGLTTNGILLMHPKRGYFCEAANKNEGEEGNDNDKVAKVHNPNNDTTIECDKMNVDPDDCPNQSNNSDTNQMMSPRNDRSISSRNKNDSNNNNAPADDNFEYGGVWREVSVDGGIYAIRESRSATQKGKRIEHETNILQDGTLIDLCGATLLWRSVDGFKSSPTKRTLEEKIDLLNASRPQCPVGLNTLVIPRKPILPGSDRHNRRSSAHHGYKDYQSSAKDYHHSSQSKSSDVSQQPYVYLKCGHVQGYHDWGTTDKSNQRTCPICLSVGTVAKLSMGLEPSFYVDSGPLTHVFNPCGHMASKRTVRYWTSIKIPHGTHFFHSICPFCATPLAQNEPTSTRLIFQEDLD